MRDYLVEIATKKMIEENHYQLADMHHLEEEDERLVEGLYKTLVDCGDRPESDIYNIPVRLLVKLAVAMRKLDTVQECAEKLEKSNNRSKEKLKKAKELVSEAASLAKDAASAAEAQQQHYEIEITQEDLNDMDAHLTPGRVFLKCFSDSCPIVRHPPSDRPCTCGFYKETSSLWRFDDIAFGKAPQGITLEARPVELGIFMGGATLSKDQALGLLKDQLHKMHKDKFKVLGEGWQVFKYVMNKIVVLKDRKKDLIDRGITDCDIAIAEIALHFSKKDDDITTDSP